MILFSELLKEYISLNRISVKKLAECVGMDRTLLQKYMSGLRRPKNKREVERISLCMLLTPEQREKLLLSYYQTVYGRKTYESFRQIKDFLEGNGNLRINRNPVLWGNFIPEKKSFAGQKENKMYFGKMQTEDALTYMLAMACKEAQGKAVSMKLIVQPDQMELIMLLLRLCSKIPVEIEHIICLDRDKENNDNFALLMPVFILACNINQYHSRYYYENTDSHLNDMSLLPNLILADNFALLCSRNANECLLMHCGDQVEFLQYQYNRIAARTEDLGISDKDSLELMQFISLISVTLRNNVRISWFPCTLLIVDQQMGEECLLLQEPQKSQLIEMMADARGRLLRGRAVREYFTEEGLHAFLKEGRLPEYFSSIFGRPDKEVRVRSVKSMIAMAEQGLIEVHMANSLRLNIAEYITVSVNAVGNVDFWYHDGEKCRTISVKESSVCENIYRFEKFACENEWFIGVKATIDKMKNILEDYAVSLVIN